MRQFTLRRSAGAAAVVLFAVLAAAPAQAVHAGTIDGVAKAAAGPGASTTSWLRIINRLTGKCLTILGSGDGAAITQATCNGSTNQVWWVDTASVGIIQSYSTGRCLDLYGNMSVNAQLVFAWSCYGPAQQLWRPVHKEGQYFELRPYYTDRCLEVAADNFADGAIVHQWGCNYGANHNQQWRLVL